MSNYRSIWAKAIRANQVLAIDREAGSSLFDQLISQHPDDGMVFYERGEAFEYLGLLDRAEADYEHAQQLLTSPHWKDVARLAIARVQRKGRSPAGSRPKPSMPAQWEVFHRIHGLPEIPHAVRVRSLSAVARIDSEPESSGADLRWCLEKVVSEVHRQKGAALPRELRAKIEFLRLAKAIPNDVTERMDCVRRFGNVGAHADGARRAPDVITALNAFAAVLEWASVKLWRHTATDRQQ